MNVRKYGNPAQYVPNNRTDKRWQKQKHTKPLGERPEAKLTFQDFCKAAEDLKRHRGHA